MASNPVRREAGQSAEDMTAQMIASREGNRLYNRKGNYKEVSDQLKAEALTAVIDQQMTLLKRVKDRGRVDLNKIDEVEMAAEAYMESCKQSNVYPSMLGFSAACGISRQWMYEYIRTHDNETSNYLDRLRSAWAAIIAQMGLSRQCSEPVAIFLLKNSGQGLSDRTDLDITARQDNYGPLGKPPTPEEIYERFKDLLIEDEEEEE